MPKLPMPELKREEKDHAIFEYPGGGNRTLVVVDDFWGEACDYARAAEDERQDIIEDFRGGLASSSAIGMILVPSLASNLSKIGTLAIGDFVRKGGLGWISAFVSKVYNKAFLIDIHDATQGRPNRILAGGDLAKSLLQKGVPRFRMGYFTSTLDDIPKLPSVTKRYVAMEDVTQLRDWWNGAFGHIDKIYFDENTDDYWPAPHDPSNLQEAHIGDSDFERFLEEQSQRDEYGVWRWVAKRLASNDEMNQLRFDYLCGKSFLGYATEDEFPFTALRGLVHGIVSGFMEVEVKDTDPVIPVPENVNYEGCFGFVSLPDESPAVFQDFADSLRGFLFELNRNKKPHSKEAVRLTSASLERGKAKAIVTLTFSGGLPTPVIQNTGKGQVTRAYQELKDSVSCSPSGNDLVLTFDLK